MTPRSAAPTFERERELGVVRGALGDARAGAGRLLVVEGPAGIGKSRLLDEAAALASETRMTALRARGGELEQGYPFGVVIDLFEPYVMSLPEHERERL